MPAGDLTRAWVSAEAALPLGWKLRGLAEGPRDLDPVIFSPEWCAWARGPKGERAAGLGASPNQALADLTVKLKALRGDPNG